MKFKVRGPDERFHVFTQVENGGWQHISRKPGDAFSVLEDGGRKFSLQEVRDYVDSLKGGGPITEDEVLWIKTHRQNGQLYEGVDWSKEGDEIEADPAREKPVVQFQCVGCGMWFGRLDKRRFTWETFPEDKGYCIQCHNRRIRDKGFQQHGM